MISAGTIAAYLTLDTQKFNRGISEAMQMLMKLVQASNLGATTLALLGTSAGTSAGTFANTVSRAFSSSAVQVRTAAQSYIVSMTDASIRVSEKVNATKNSLLSIGSITGTVSAKSQATVNAIKAPFQSLSTSAYSIMSNVGSGLIRGLSSKKSSIISTARSIAGSVVSTLKSALRIASPSKVMMQIGEQTAQGLVVGISSGVPDVSRNAQALANAVAGQSYSASRGGTADMSSIAGRLDQLISLLSAGEQVMQVDGRTFARLIKEYS